MISDLLLYVRSYQKYDRWSERENQQKCGYTTNLFSVFFHLRFIRRVYTLKFTCNLVVVSRSTFERLEVFGGILEVFLPS